MPKKDIKLASITRGCRINDRIFSAVVRKAKRGEFVTEKEIAKFIDSEIRKAGAGNAFPTIVAIGPNAVGWHHRPTSTKLSRGFCVIDFGARVNRYCSDMTRTVFFGKATAKEKKIYGIARRANEECIKKIRAGADGSKIYFFARKLLGGYAKYFGHGLGHGLKKIIHAKPRLKKKKAVLHEGDIITIEPGVYIPKKLGIRIEDDVLVTRKGFRVISRSAKKLVEINLGKHGKK